LLLEAVPADADEDDAPPLVDWGWAGREKGWGGVVVRSG